MLRRRVLVLMMAALTASPVLAQGRRNDHWVATWATALVARPQGPVGGRGQGAPPAPAPAQPGPGIQGAAPAPPAAAVAPGGAPGGGGGRVGGPPPVTISNQTIRQIVRTSIGGSRVRVVLSNVFGTAPLEIGAAHIAPRQADATLAGTAGPLTFGGNPSGIILPGAVLVSDPVDLAVPPLTELAIDLFLPGEL